MQEFTDQEIQAKAERLGVIQPGEELPRHHRSRVVAVLMQERRALGAPTDDGAPREPLLAQRIVIQPGGAITVDGRPFPWIVQAEDMAVTLHPDGSGLVRLTLPTRSVQIIKPNESERS